MIKLYHFQSEFQKPNHSMDQNQQPLKIIAICINNRQAIKEIDISQSM